MALICVQCDLKILVIASVLVDAPTFHKHGCSSFSAHSRRSGGVCGKLHGAERGGGGGVPHDDDVRTPHRDGVRTRQHGGGGHMQRTDGGGGGDDGGGDGRGPHRLRSLGGVPQ